MPSFFLCFRELKISFADLKFNDLTVCSGAMLCAECNVLRLVVSDLQSETLEYQHL